MKPSLICVLKIAKALSKSLTPLLALLFCSAHSTTYLCTLPRSRVSFLSPASRELREDKDSPVLLVALFSCLEQCLA